MKPRFPERNKRAGVFYATTDDGLELPVVDVTHPVFVAQKSAAELAAIAEASLHGMAHAAKMPRVVLWLLKRRSILMRGTMAAAGGYASGITTYLYKLGPENLGRGYAGSLDRRMAGAITPVCVRMRLRETAELLAEGLLPALQASPGPLHFVNIAGGCASDTLNALILLRKQHPELLAGRTISIHVLDSDRAGPRFGERCLEALCATAGPLQGLQASWHHLEYDWNRTASLRHLLRALERESVLAVSSEGGLFEYGSDEAIVANLEELRGSAPPRSLLVGSFLRDEVVPRAIKEMSKMTLRLFDLEGVGRLALRAGWAVDRAAEGNPLYGVVRLRPPAEASPVSSS
jgi:hypothetical protein